MNYNNIDYFYSITIHRHKYTKPSFGQHSGYCRSVITILLAKERHLVPRSRFELPHPLGRHPLKVVRLPISPPGHFVSIRHEYRDTSTADICNNSFLFKFVPEERLELSRILLQRLLRPQRLPISPSGRLKGLQIYKNY